MFIKIIWQVCVCASNATNASHTGYKPKQKAGTIQPKHLQVAKKSVLPALLIALTTTQQNNGANPLINGIITAAKKY